MKPQTSHSPELWDTAGLSKLQDWHTVKCWSKIIWLCFCGQIGKHRIIKHCWHLSMVLQCHYISLGSSDREITVVIKFFQPKNSTFTIEAHYKVSLQGSTDHSTVIRVYTSLQGSSDPSTVCLWYLRIGSALLATELSVAVCGIHHLPGVSMYPGWKKSEGVFKFKFNFKYFIVRCTEQHRVRLGTEILITRHRTTT